MCYIECTEQKNSSKARGKEKKKGEIIMAQIRDYSKLAADILREVGGEENIVHATRCATRLRLELKDTPKEAKARISEMPGVITVAESGGQFQVVIGTHVGDVYEAFSKLVNMEAMGGEENAPKQSVLNRIIATMSAVFAPFVYILAAAGILQGILILITMAAPSFAETGTYEVLSFMSWTPFSFLPVFIAVTASKHFKCNPYIALVCCCALINPSWAEMAARIAGGEEIRFLFLKLSETTYTSSVLPPLFLVWILSYLEKFLNKHLPDVIKPLLTPFLCLVIMVPFTMLLLGPASTLVANGIAVGYNYLVKAAPTLTGAIIGGLWQVVVIFGVHWGITPVNIANFEMNGCDSFQAFQTIAVVAQMGAAFGCYLKSKNKEFKGVALSAGITGIFGITEPAIYGVTLRLKKPFVCGCISGAVGAVVMSFFHSMYYAYAGLPSLLTTVNAISKDAPMSFVGEILGCAIAIVGSILLVQFVGFDDPVPAGAVAVNPGEGTNETQSVQAAGNVQTKASADKKMEIASPMTGTVCPVTEVKDPVFNSEAMGKGIAVIPVENKVYAPFDGTVVSLIDTHHALGIEGNGMELLIHVGMDTVKLNGRYFTPHVTEGQKVKKGDLLLEFDLEGIKGEGYELTTPVVVTNSDDFAAVSWNGKREVKAGELLLTVE